MSALFDDAKLLRIPDIGSEENTHFILYGKMYRCILFSHRSIVLPCYEFYVLINTPPLFASSMYCGCLSHDLLTWDFHCLSLMSALGSYRRNAKKHIPIKISTSQKASPP